MKIANHGDPLTTVLCLSTFVPDEHPLAESFITFFEKAKKEPKLIQVFAAHLGWVSGTTRKKGKYK